MFIGIGIILLMFGGWIGGLILLMLPKDSREGCADFLIYGLRGTGLVILAIDLYF